MNGQTCNPAVVGKVFTNGSDTSSICMLAPKGSCPSGTFSDGTGNCITPNPNGGVNYSSINRPAGYYGDGYGNCILSTASQSNNTPQNPITQSNSNLCASVGTGYSLSTNNSQICCPAGYSYACGGGQTCASSSSECSASSGTQQNTSPITGSGSSNSSSNSNPGTSTPNVSKSPLGGYCGAVADCDTSQGTLSGNEQFDCINSQCVIRHSDGGGSNPVSNTDCDSGIDCTSGGVSPNAICVGSGTNHTAGVAYCLASKLDGGYQCTRNEQCGSGTCTMPVEQGAGYGVCSGSGNQLSSQVSTKSETAPQTPAKNGSTSSQTSCESQDQNGCFTAYYSNGQQCSWQQNQNTCVTIGAIANGQSCTWDNACKSNHCDTASGTCQDIGNDQGGLSAGSSACTTLDVTGCFNKFDANGNYACSWGDDQKCVGLSSLLSGATCDFNNACKSGVCNTGAEGTGGTCQ